MKLGFGTQIFRKVSEAREKEWENAPGRQTWARELMLHSSRIIACNPTDHDAILRATQSMKLFLTRLENAVQGGEAQK